MAFQLTSKAIALDGITLTATCRGQNGMSAKSTLDLNTCIANIDGKLVKTVDGNFAASCSDIWLNGTILRCMAQRTNGDRVTAQINLANFIANKDGRLVAEIN
jgi:hypothetical protein